MIRGIVLVGSLAIVAISVLALLGEDDADAPRLKPPPETADPLPALPRGWTASENDAIGVALGVPPGWSDKAGPASTTLRSPGSAVVVSVTADRTQEAIDADLEGYALDVASQIGGADAAVAKSPEPGLGYEAAAARSGDTEVVVVRRRELAAYPMLVTAAASVKKRELDPFVEAIVASLRGRPVTGK